MSRFHLPAAFSVLCVLLLGGVSAVDACRDPVVPGGDWKDDRGKVISATEGGIIQVKGLWYMWGMDRSANNSYFVGINLYSSTDLVHWKYIKQVLRHDSDPLLDNNAVVERAKILQNKRTGKFVMWMHYEGHNAYSVAEVGMAVADSITGDFVFKEHYRPLDLDSRDLNVYQDDDGKAYLICTTKGNQNVSLFELDSTYMKIKSEIYRGSAADDMECEGHAIVKSKGRYYWMMSWCSGWDFNDNRYFTATSLEGPWSAGSLVATSGTHTYESQVGWAFAMPGNDGANFVYMGDRWSVGDFAMTRMVMLPFTIAGTTLSVQWFDRWYPGADSGWQRGEPYFPDGVYSIRSRATGKVLAVPSSASGGKLRMVPDSGTNSQRWKLAAINGSEYQFTSVLSGLRMEISGSSRDAGANAIHYADNGGFNQRWHLVQSAPDAWRMVNENTLGKVLQVADASTANGAQAVLGQYASGAHQEWNIVPVVSSVVDGRSYVFIAKHSSKVLTTGATGMEQRADSSLSTQVWRAKALGNGWWAFEQDGKRLGVPGDSVVDGAALGLVSDTGTGSRWKMVDDGSGNLQIVNGCSGKTLDVNGGESATADGAKVMLYRWWNTKNQKWGAREAKASGIVPRIPSSRRFLSVAQGRILVDGDLARWSSIELFDHVGRRVATLPVAAIQGLPRLGSGLYRVRLSGPDGERNALAVVP